MPAEREWPSVDVLRIVHAFGDAGRKAAVRALAARVKAHEDELLALRKVAEAGEALRRALPSCRAWTAEECDLVQALDDLPKEAPDGND